MTRTSWIAWILMLSLCLGGCAGPADPARPEKQPEGVPQGRPAPEPATALPAEASGEGDLRVVVLGDSLAAGLGLEADQAFPALLEDRLRERGLPVKVVNAGVSGDTTAGGLSRLDWVLGQEPELLVVELGANDGLRGLSPEMSESNLRAIIGRARKAGVRVLLLGMRLPPNYGGDYVRRFEAIFPRLAEELEVPFVPFFLEQVAGRPELNLADGIHPNAEGQRLAAEHLLPHLEEVLLRIQQAPNGP